MPTEIDVVEVTRRTLIDFCKEFVEHPYLCYTEHGLHALFYSRLYSELPPELRYQQCGSHKICLIQKEYPTHHRGEKPRRQHWDVSVIKTPIVLPTCRRQYDHLPLAAVVEFGLNCPTDHLEDDIKRLSHSNANVDHPFAVHLYRLADAKARVSRRDWAPQSKILCAKESVQVMLKGRSVVVYYGVVDATGRNQSGLWRVTGHSVDRLLPEASEVAT